MPADFQKYIYHFTTVEKALLYILPSLKLKLSPFLNTNDPKENKTFGFWSIFNDCDDFKTDKIKEAFKSFLDNYCKLVCFSKDYTISQNGTDFYISGFNHPTMWAHYGDNYKGICVVLNQDTFKADNFENDDDLFDSVNYSHCLEFPPIDFSKWEKRQDDYFKKYLFDNAKDFFFTKYFHWQSEDEKRFVHLGSKEFCSIKNSIAGVFVGNNFDDELMKLIKKYLPGENTWIGKISISDGRLFPIQKYPNNENN